jgi:hypothetical protein
MKKYLRSKQQIEAHRLHRWKRIYITDPLLLGTWFIANRVKREMTIINGAQ